MSRDCWDLSKKNRFKIILHYQIIKCSWIQTLNHHGTLPISYSPSPSLSHIVLFLAASYISSDLRMDSVCHLNHVTSLKPCHAYSFPITGHSQTWVTLLLNLRLYISSSLLTLPPSFYFYFFCSLLFPPRKLPSSFKICRDFPVCYQFTRVFFQACDYIDHVVHREILQTSGELAIFL